MEIKKNLKISTDDFWYDLIDGGYLKPKEICENEKDIEKINKAIEVLSDFQTSCEKDIEGFIQ